MGPACHRATVPFDHNGAVLSVTSAYQKDAHCIDCFKYRKLRMCSPSPSWMKQCNQVTICARRHVSTVERDTEREREREREKEAHGSSRNATTWNWSHTVGALLRRTQYPAGIAHSTLVGAAPDRHRARGCAHAAPQCHVGHARRTRWPRLHSDRHHLAAHVVVYRNEPIANGHHARADAIDDDGDGGVGTQR